MTLALENLILSLIGTEPNDLKPIVISFRQGCYSSIVAQAIRKLELI